MSTGANQVMPTKGRIMEPRRYQLDLVDYLSERNGIVYLPTGAGKTYVAILAIMRFSQQLQRSIAEGGKRVIFMCNTVELARQQAVEMRKSTNLKVGFYVGERDVDNWSRQKWNDEIVENQVLVGTAQIFLDIVTQNYLKITDLSLVIIDECHHGTKSHPMHEFMRLFQYAKEQAQLPRVIGLTGVLLKGNKINNIQKELEDLEATFRGNIVTVSSMEEFNNVMVYSTKPKEEMITYKNSVYEFDLVERIKAEITELANLVDGYELGNIPLKLCKGLGQLREPSKKKFIKNLLVDFVHQMTDLGLYAANIAIMSPIIAFEVKKRQAQTLALRNLYRIVITKCEHLRHLLMKKLTELNDDDDAMGAAASSPRSSGIDEAAANSMEAILNYSSPKMLALLMYMKKKFMGKQPNDISCLIFVDRRYSAKCLYYVIQKFVELTPELVNVVRPQFMIGRNSVLPGIESILDRKWNKTAIENFRTKECNVIICSRVLEEGIDVQACNYVFAFDPLQTFNSYIQTKGRARSIDSTYAIFSPKLEEVKVIEQLRKYQKIHAIIQHFLIGRILDRAEPCDNAIAEQFVDTIAPFQIANGACLLSSSALTLLNRYCQTLPNDMFGTVAPWFSKSKSATGRDVVCCRLPLQSPLKETIISDEIKNAKLMRISAAFKTCKRLYELGELNDKLLPITKHECVGKVAEVLFQHWAQFNDDVRARRMGKQFRRCYDRKCPEELYEALPVVGHICYAYEIQFNAHFEAIDYTQHVLDMLDGAKYASNYALLLRHRLPPLAEMPLFMNQGGLGVKINDQPLECRIDSVEELELLRRFHLMIFRDLLQLWKNFFVLDGRNKENSYLIVPLMAAGAAKQIDWQLVRNFQRLAPQRTYNVMERQRMVYRPEDYVGKVVNKWYSGVDDERYVVTAVRTDLTPLSPFSNDDYQNFEHFTISRFGNIVGRITQPQQFLLEVHALTSRRNFFINATGKSSARIRKHNVIFLIPELCHNFMYPGDMWLKALFLPCILHRVYFMLHADTLRRRINRFLDVPLAVDKAYRPTPLTVDCSLKRVIDTDGNAIEQEEEPKKLLPSLPAKRTEQHFEVQSLMSNDCIWKEYMEPTDHARYPNAVYPVEIDYYYKFITGLGNKLEALVLEDETKWTANTHLNMVTPSAAGSDAASKKVADGAANVSTLAIEDVSLCDKQRIKILERSFDKSSTGATLLHTAEQSEFLAAITASKANDVFDMERFEILGDSFLKFGVSLYLANKYPQWHEGFLTEIKSRLVSNRNLLYCLLVDDDIPKRISAMLLNPKAEWMPPLASLPHNIITALYDHPGLLAGVSPADLYGLKLSDADVLSGMCPNEQMEVFMSSCRRNQEITASGVHDLDNEMNIFLHRAVMPDKVVADTLEALLGVCVKNYGIHRGFRMLEFFGICRPDVDKPLTNLLNLDLGSPLLRTNITAAEVDGFLINYAKLEENLGYKFRDRAFLLQALTHPSYPTNRLTGCYQQLEFIGDAILDFLISSYIFERFEYMAPGQVTDLRSALVNNITLGCICVRHRFHLFLLFENAVLSESIKKFAEFQATQGHRVTDQVRILLEEDGAIATRRDGDNGQNFNMSVNVDVPKALGDIVEALIAAVYLDCRDLFTTWHLIYRLMEPELNAFVENVPLDAVRQLYEHKTANAKFADPVIDDEVVMIKCMFSCLDNCIEVNGFGVNTKQAKKAAAKHALHILAKSLG